MTVARPSAAFRAFARPWLIVIACGLFTVQSATPAFAQDDEEDLPDARLTGYYEAGAPVDISVGGGVALSYAMVAFLGAISVGITFKNARRTHLD